MNAVPQRFVGWLMTTAKIDSLNLDAAALKHVQDAYLYDDATLASATPGDVAGLPPGLRVRLRAAFPNLAEAPTQAHTVHKHTATGNALLADLDDRPAAVAEVVRRLASGDKSPGLLAAAKRLGVTAVARLDGKVSVEVTASYVAHLEAGGTVRESWKDHELVSLEELASKVCVSPTDSGELEDGVDPRTGIDWSAMSDEGLAQVRFASKDGMLKGMPDRVVFVAFRDAATNTAEDKALVDRVKRRMKAAKANAEALLRELRRPMGDQVKVTAQTFRDLATEALRPLEEGSADSVCIDCLYELRHMRKTGSVEWSGRACTYYLQLPPRGEGGGVDVSSTIVAACRERGYQTAVSNYRGSGFSVTATRPR